jgi:hypothetical protein
LLLLHSPSWLSLLFLRAPDLTIIVVITGITTAVRPWVEQERPGLVPGLSAARIGFACGRDFQREC